MTTPVEVRRRGPISGVLSQGLNSGSNFLLALTIAATTAPAELGSWSILYTILTFALTVSRAVVSTSFLLRGEHRAVREARSGLYSLNVCLGILTAVGVLGAGLLLDWWLAVAIASALPVVLLQDSLRYVAFANSRPGTAIALDAVWLSIQIVGSALLLINDRESPTTLTLAWLLGAAAGCLLLVVPAFRAPLSAAHARRYAIRERQALTGLSFESVLSAVAANSSPIIVGLVAGLAGAGAFRLALTLIGPLAIVVAGMTPLATVRVQQLTSFRSQYVFLAEWSALVVALAVAAGMVFLAIPGQLADRLLGPSWSLASALMLPLLAQAALRGPLTAIPILLRTSRNFPLLIRLSAVTSTITMACTLLGGLARDELGAAWGLMAASCVGVVLYCWSFSVAFRRPADTQERVP